MKFNLIIRFFYLLNYFAYAWNLKIIQFKHADKTERNAIKDRVYNFYVL